VSWLFGIVGSSIAPDVISKVEAFIPEPLYTYRSQTTYIVCGGLRETCFSSIEKRKKDDTGKNWIMCGIGISPEIGERKHIFTTDDWDALLQQSEPCLDTLEGHFAAVVWNKKRILGFVDSRGIRDLYIATYKQHTIFSTRLDWFARCGLSCSIDFSRFGSRWLAFNQLSHKSILEPIERLGPGAHFELSDDRYMIHQPDLIHLPQREYPLDAIISSLVTFPLYDGYTIILCLSGGVDSRVLLSTLLSVPREQWKVCIFGERHHPDVAIARHIVNDLQLPYIYLDGAVPDVSSIIQRMHVFVAHTHCVSPATDAIRLGSYEKTYGPRNIIIDGAFGEIMRRTYFNRLLIRGKTVLLSGATQKIVPYIRSRRADIFNSSVSEIMYTGLVEDIELMFQRFPEKDLIHNTENMLDFIAINTRLSNLFGPEVSRLDHIVLNYMPFAQPSLLGAVLQIPIHVRKSGHFSKAYIKKRKHMLTKYPLVKDTVIYPYTISHPVFVRLWKELRHMVGISYHDSVQIEILKKLETFIKDTVSSKSTRSYPPYNIEKINTMVDQFYRGEYGYADDVAWWLSFELWRRQMC
jgi:hypothetical protein